MSAHVGRLFTFFAFPVHPSPKGKPMSSSTEQSARPTAAPAEVADAGKVRTGMGFKILPAKTPAAVQDSGKVRTGMGFKVF
jgi:hypothetical protein